MEAEMDQLGTWLPIVLGGIIILAVAVKVFRDPAVNNFLGYILLAAVALCALPAVQNFSYKGALGEVTTSMKTAEINQTNYTANISSALTDLNKKIDGVVEKLNAAATPQVQSTLTPQYQANRSYQVSVFYSNDATQANKIRDFLLNLGYRSSATYTDYSGGTPPAQNSIRLLVTRDAPQSFIDDLQAKLRQKFPNLAVQLKPVDRLNSGDAQVQLL
jgi:hypothetical protein